MPYDLKPIDLDVETTPYIKEGEQQGDRWTLNFGPQHPSTHTTLRLVMELDGERVARVTPHIGYLHSGFEKLGEALGYHRFIPYTDRLDYLAPLSNNCSIALAAEQVCGIQSPPTIAT